MRVPQQGSVANKWHTDAKYLGCHWWPSGCLRSILPLESCWSKWPVLPYGAIVCSRPELLLRAMYGSIALWQPGSELISVVPVATEDCAVSWCLICHLEPYWYPCAMLHPGLYSYKCYILNSGEIWAWATARGQVWVCDLTATRICGSGCQKDHVNSWGLGCHLGTCCLRTSLLPQPFWPVWPATRKHGGIWTQVTAEDHIWLHGPIIASVCVEIHNPWSHEGPDSQGQIKLPESMLKLGPCRSEQLMLLPNARWYLGQRCSWGPCLGS